MTLRGYVFLKLDTAKDVVSHMSRKPRLGTRFDSQYVNSQKICTTALSSYCGITFAEILLENVRLSDI